VFVTLEKKEIKKKNTLEKRNQSSYLPILSPKYSGKPILHTNKQLKK
jgi:hypothetical protein